MAPAMVATVLFFAAACAPSGASLAQEQELYLEHDELSLLQSEAVVKTGAPRTAQLGTDRALDMPVMGSSGRPNFCSAAVPVEGAVPAMAQAVADATEEKELIQCPSVGQLPPSKVASVTDVAQAKSYFVCVLEVIVVLMILDGCRRYQDQRAGAAKATQAPRTKGSWDDLMKAALQCDEKKCLQLLGGARCPSVSIVGEDPWGCTVLHAAARGGSACLVQRLLECGASVHDRDAWDETPLHMAARTGSIGCCEALIAFGAEVDPLNADDRTPLLAAAEGGQEATCQFLLGRGATAGGLDDTELPALLSNILACNLLAACGAATPAYEDGDSFEHPNDYDNWDDSK